MRLRASLFAVAAFAAVGAAAWMLGDHAAGRIEAKTRQQLADAMSAAGQDWVGLGIDGLIVAVEGEAPDETSRFRAMEIARQIVSAGRVEDRVRVAAASALAPPPFALELLRNDDEVSLIGLVPAAGARDAIASALAGAGLGGLVTDMLETADHPAPPGWSSSLGYGLAVLAILPRAKVRIEPGAVAVEAVAENAAERDLIAERLEAMAPAGVALALDIAAPRAVVAPFAVDFRHDGRTGRLIACTAETEEAAEAILAAARSAGLAGTADCALGLGAPSPDWAEVAAAGIAAVADLGGGRFELRDLEAVLAGPAGGDPGALAEAGAGLGAALPAIYALATRGEAPAADEEDAGEASHAPVFRAELRADGSLQLAGPVLDRTAQVAVIGFAEALFGHARVVDATVLDPDLPDGWPGRVLAGVEALSLLDEGSLEVTGDLVRVAGSSLDEDAAADVEAFFAAKTNGRAIVEVAHDAARAEAARVLAAAARAAEVAAATALRPPAEVCTEEIKALLAVETILFETGSSTIDAGSEGVIDAIADILATCPGARFEIAGHTDSQGPAAVNQRISEDRAAAVVDALEDRGLTLVTLVPHGYGADRPIADNETEEGRARNRRIEFAAIRGGEIAAAGGGEVGDAPEGGGAEGGEAVAGTGDDAAGDVANGGPDDGTRAGATAGEEP